MKKINNYKNQGLSLLEVIIALAIASLIALGLVRATGSAVKNSRFSADQSQVTALAQEKIAKIVDYKNKSSKNFWDNVESNPGAILTAVGIVPEDKSLSDTCFVTAVNSNIDWSGSAPADPNAKMAKITVDVFWGAKNNDPDCDNTSFSHTLHFETNVTN